MYCQGQCRTLISSNSFVVLVVCMVVVGHFNVHQSLPVVEVVSLLFCDSFFRTRPKINSRLSYHSFWTMRQACSVEMSNEVDAENRTSSFFFPHSRPFIAILGCMVYVCSSLGCHSGRIE